ncbi:MAG: translation elongation factor Ts [Gammaproteobacteria bacterium]
MMAITAALVKELRERTGLGMMECKKALVETNGDIETAIENLRKSGQAKAAKKAGRTAAEGVVAVQSGKGYGLMLEVNSETDFVAMDDNFKQFVEAVVVRAFELKQPNVAELATCPIREGESTSVEEARQALVQKVGENIQIRRAQEVEGEVIGSYVHNTKIAVLVGLKGGDEALAKDIAMHIAAANPIVCKPEDLPADVLEKEKEIYLAQAASSGKPAEIAEKMVQGRLRKYQEEVSLVAQAFVKDPDQKIGDLLKRAEADVLAFVRFEVGEGIEKEEKDFATEVMEQAKGQA